MIRSYQLSVVSYQAKFDETRKAHICRKWALVENCPQLRASSVVVILQTFCKAVIGKIIQISVTGLQLPVGNASLAVDFGGAA